MFILKRDHFSTVNSLNGKICELEDELRRKQLETEKIKRKAEEIYQDLVEEIKILRKVASEYKHPHTCGWCGGHVHKEGEMHGKCLDAMTNALMQI